MNNNNNNLMLIDAADPSEVRVVVLQNGDIDHFDFISKSKPQIKGNIYLGKITRIEPSLQAAFVEYGGEKQGFLSFSEIHHDYYQIPVEDRKKLQEEMEQMAERMAARADYDGDEDEAPPSPARQKSKPKAEQSSDVEIEPEVKTKGKVRRRGGRRKNLNNRNDIALDTENNANIEASPEVMAAIDAGQNEQAAQPEPVQTTAQIIDIEDKPIAMSAESSDDNVIAVQEQEPQSQLEQSEQNEQPSKEIEVVQESKEQQENQEVVQSGNIDETEELRHNNYPVHRRYKIQEVLKPGQLVLVQVIKEERGNKGVSVSTFISLAGRYCVVMPNSPKAGGISRKIGSGEDRKRLREISDELQEISKMSAIIRTAGLDRSKAEIKRDYEYLINLWNKVREDALSSIAPALVYEENDIIKRSIRDHYDAHLEGGVLVQGDLAYRKAKEFMKLLMPSHATKIKQYKSNAPLLAEYGAESMLAELYRPTAPLKSGGYLVINPTEALISVDVNSGRSTNEKNVEETAYRTNLEACDELARQLRLRNLGGLIVVDFIDMSYHKYRRNVERALKEALKDDRAKIQIGTISTFGLLELSRQRIGSSLEESTTHACPACSGSGRVPMPEAVALQLLRNLQYFLSEYEEGGVVNIALSQPLMLELLNNHRAMLDKLAVDFKVSFAFEMHPENRDMAYNFKGKGNARFDSVLNSERKGKFASKNKQRSKNRPEKNVTEKSVKEGHIKEEITNNVVATENVDVSQADDNIVAEAIDGEAVVKKSRRRGKRGGKNQQRRKLEGKESATDDGNNEVIIANEVAADAPLEITVTEAVAPANPAPKATSVRRRQTVAKVAKIVTPTSNEVELNIMEIAPLPKATTELNNPQEKITQENPTAPANSEPRRKGWWQRVLDA